MNKKDMNITPGLTLLIMVFIVLCMTTFATLYYLEAKSSYDLSVKSYNMIEEYYKTDSEMMKIYDNYQRLKNNNELDYQTNDIINVSLDINDKQKLNAGFKVCEDKIEIVYYKRVVNK